MCFYNAQCFQFRGNGTSSLQFQNHSTLWFLNYQCHVFMMYFCVCMYLSLLYFMMYYTSLLILTDRFWYYFQTFLMLDIPWDFCPARKFWFLAVETLMARKIERKENPKSASIQQLFTRSRNINCAFKGGLIMRQLFCFVHVQYFRLWFINKKIDLWKCRQLAGRLSDDLDLYRGTICIIILC